MKQRAGNLPLALVLGFMASVTTAFACTMWVPPSCVVNEPMPEDYRAWHANHCPADGEPRPDAELRVRYGLGFELQRSDAWAEEPGAPRVRVDSWRTVAGWPFFCLDGASWHVTTWSDAVADEVTMTHAVVMPDRIGPIEVQNTDHGTVLPLRPLWGGLVLNVIIWTAGFMALRIGFVTIRGARRRLHGRCATCGYLLHGASRCSECGH